MSSPHPLILRLSSFLYDFRVDSRSAFLTIGLFPISRNLSFGEAQEKTSNLFSFKRNSRRLDKPKPILNSVNLLCDNDSFSRSLSLWISVVSEISFFDKIKVFKSDNFDKALVDFILFPVAIKDFKLLNTPIASIFTISLKEILRVIKFDNNDISFGILSIWLFDRFKYVRE